jgi:hypothetical protein
MLLTMAMRFALRLFTSNLGRCMTLASGRSRLVQVFDYAVGREISSEKQKLTYPSSQERIREALF